MALTSISRSAYVFLSMLLCLSCCEVCYGFGTFGFDIHHRFSDPVKGILDISDLPEKGSVQYYAAMAKRDRVFHGRKLAFEDDQMQELLTFADGNDTYRINSMGFLHYANISVGTPRLSFLVALDTGSDLFWLPCDCTSCVQGLVTTSGDEIDLNIYSPNASSTSSKVPCKSTICEHRDQCSSAGSNCPYRVRYVSNGTSSTGYLVEDVLHLTTDDGHSKNVQPRITFGCGKRLTGAFLDVGAPNGLFGLGMDNVSVPSILASEGVASNSFSMCFGQDGVGRITFGDKGSSDQAETPFRLLRTHPTYNISVLQVSVGGDTHDMGFSAICDSGTSFTYLNDPAYTFISESFNSKTNEKRHRSDSGLPFEYCYNLSPNQVNITAPTVNLTMEGGRLFPITDPIVLISLEGTYLYCLGVVKSGDVNIIGQNFMTGYRIVFDREKMVLGWKPSNCYDIESSNTLPINPPSSAEVPPLASVIPQATKGSGNSSQVPGTLPPMANYSPRTTTFSYPVMIVIVHFLAALYCESFPTPTVSKHASGLSSS